MDRWPDPRREKAYLYVDSTSTLVLRRLADGSIGRGGVTDFGEGIAVEVWTTPGGDVNSHPPQINATAALLFDAVSGL